MPNRSRSAFWSLSAAGLCWLLLLLSTLSQHPPQPGQWPAAPNWLLLAAQAGFVAGTFVFVRFTTPLLQGHNFLGLLRRLFRQVLLLAAGLGAVVVAEYFVRNHSVPLPGDATLAFTHTVGLGLFIVLLARMMYTWQALVLFRSNSRLRREWSIFELLLGAVLLLQLFISNVPDTLRISIITALGLYGLYLSGHQRWVAYLSQQQKWAAIAMQLGLLGFLVLFALYLRESQLDPLLLGPATQHAFLVLSSLFAAFYALAGLFVSLFNLPTARVFEQRRSEILGLQQLSQIIQRGQSSTEIYQSLFRSAMQTSGANAAWLTPEAQPHDLPGTVPATLSDGLTPELLAAIQERIGPQIVTSEQFVFVDNDLPRSQRLRGLQVPFGSVAALPLRSPMHNYGTLVLLKNEAHSFEREDLSILHTFTSQTVLSLENLQLQQESINNQRTQDELRIASQVQDSLIPKHLPTDNWFEISSHSLAAKEVGGDFYDFLHLPGRRLAVVIGDVSGKGVTAAFHMAQMKGIFHALMQENPLAKSDRDKFPLPSRFMTQANAALTHCLERSSFITSTLYIIDYEQGGFMFARAGHCHTLYYHAMREEVFYFESTGLGLGIIRNESYERHISNQFYDYGPGDVMVIYTDGIVEARGPGDAEYGEDRLKERLQETYFRSAEEIKENILTDLNAFTYGLPVHDDQTLLVIKFKASQPEPLA